VFTFKGLCSGDRGTIQVTTEFPVAESIDAYNERRIGLDQVDVNVNAPVSVVFDSRTQAYSFELPYLFLTSRQSSRNIYSLIAPRVGDSYATDVTNRWECKAVKSSDVTYRFLICRTAIVARNSGQRDRNLGFGAAAYFIMSDGMEAQTSVNLSFGNAGQPAANPPDTASPPVFKPRPSLTRSETPGDVRGWQMPDVRSKIVDLGKNEFRLRFNSQTWTGKIDSPAVLSDEKLSSLLSAKAQEGADYCTWRPEAPNPGDRLLADNPDADISYSMETIDKSSRSAASIVFQIKTRTGTGLGRLQCFFPRAGSAASIAFDRWISIVGGHFTLEIRR